MNALFKWNANPALLQGLRGVSAGSVIANKFLQSELFILLFTMLGHSLE